MQPNWDYVKKTTLWHYEDLIKKLKAVAAYPVIWHAYNHDMTQADTFARRLFPDKTSRWVNFLPVCYPLLRV